MARCQEHRATERAAVSQEELPCTHVAGPWLRRDDRQRSLSSRHDLIEPSRIDICQWQIDRHIPEIIADRLVDVRAHEAQVVCALRVALLPFHEVPLERRSAPALRPS